MSALGSRFQLRLRTGATSARHITLKIPADFPERFCKALARRGISTEAFPLLMRYGGHDVSRQPRDEQGRWTVGPGSGQRSAADHGAERSSVSSADQTSPTNASATESRSSGLDAAGSNSSLNPSGVPQAPVQSTSSSRPANKAADPKLTLAQEEALWARQAEIQRLQLGIRAFEKDLKNPNLSPSHRKSLQRGMEECRDNLAQLIYETNGFIATGNLARGNDPVATMPILHKLEAALRRAITSGQLAADVREKLEELLRPENLAMMAAFVAGYAAAHATPLAPGLVVVDAYMLGSGATEAGTALFQAYLDLENATTAQELEQASKGLSKLLAGPIVDALMKVVVGGAAKGSSAVTRRIRGPGKPPSIPTSPKPAVPIKETARPALPGPGAKPAGKPSVPPAAQSGIRSSGTSAKSPASPPPRSSSPPPPPSSPPPPPHPALQPPVHGKQQVQRQPVVEQRPPSSKPPAPPPAHAPQQNPSPNVQKSPIGTRRREPEVPKADGTDSTAIVKRRAKESIETEPLTAKPLQRVETNHVKRRSANGGAQKSSTGGTTTLEMSSGNRKSTPQPKLKPDSKQKPSATKSKVPKSSTTSSSSTRTSSTSGKTVSKSGTKPSNASSKKKPDSKPARPKKPSQPAKGSAKPKPPIRKATVKLYCEPGWDRRHFNRKFRALQKLAKEGKLRKAPNPVARKSGLTGDYKSHLIRVAYAKFGKKNPAKFEAFRNRVTSSHADHIHELQLCGLDDTSNLWILDADVNIGIGAQIRQQIKNLPDGTVIHRIKLGDR